MHITVINGTNRPNNRSLGVSKLIISKLESMDNITAQLIGPADFDLSVDGNDEENKSEKYTEIVNKTDAFIIVSPEYNHSFPGSLKSLLDKELKAYNKKAVGLVGVSSGMFGGARVVENLLSVVRELGLIISTYSLHIQGVAKVVEADGELLDQSYNEKVDSFINELLWVAKATKWGRENL